MSGYLKKIAKDSAIYGIGNMVTKAVSFVMIPIYTSYLTPTDYGTLALLDILAAVVVLALMMEIHSGLFRF